MIKLQESDKLLTLQDVSIMLHVHPNTLRRWADEGLLKTYRFGIRGDRRFKFSDIQELLEGSDR